MFGAAGREHMKKYGTTAEHFAKIGYKNHKHSVNNPYAQFQDEYTLDDILASKMISDPLTKLQCSPTSDGSRRWCWPVRITWPTTTLPGGLWKSSGRR